MVTVVWSVWVFIGCAYVLMYLCREFTAFYSLMTLLIMCSYMIVC
jgi:hypothetical protein